MARENSIEILSTRNCGKKHISYNTILAMENEFVEAGCLLLSLNPCAYWINKILNKLFKISIEDPSVRKVKKSNKYKFFISMDYRDLEVYSRTLLECRDNLILYVFDCWEPQWCRYEKIFNKIQPAIICFAYEKSAEHFQNKGKYKTMHLPQSMDSKTFTPGSEEKTRLFMQMGRRTSVLHNMCLDYLKGYNIPNSDENYVYEREKGKLIFPENADLVKEMRKSFFFLVAPQCIDNYSHTGEISEVTARFYEAMATKTLCVGIKPKDNFDRLFPHPNAMIEVNEENFEDRIRELLIDENRYKEIVEFNYEYLIEHHKWKNRLESILDFIEYH